MICSLNSFLKRQGVRSLVIKIDKHKVDKILGTRNAASVYSSWGPGSALWGEVRWGRLSHAHAPPGRCEVSTYQLFAACCLPACLPTSVLYRFRYVQYVCMYDPHTAHAERDVTRSCRSLARPQSSSRHDLPTPTENNDTTYYSGEVFVSAPTAGSHDLFRITYFLYDSIRSRCEEIYAGAKLPPTPQKLVTTITRLKLARIELHSLKINWFSFTKKDKDNDLHFRATCCRQLFLSTVRTNNRLSSERTSIQSCR